jgi:hypothetical protein
MARYTEEQRQQVLTMWPEMGTAETERLTGVEARTILRYVNEAGLMTHDKQEKTTAARAAAAERVTNAWADFRSAEALAAGAAANRMRREALEASAAATNPDGTWPHPQIVTAQAGLLRARVVAYGIFIDKAELLSGQATQRIQVWSESEVDRDLKAAMAEMEERIRGES